MELSNTEIKIVVKNMARELVKKATVKNAMRFKYGDKVTVDGKYEGVVQAVKDGYYEVRIFDGSRVVGTKVVWPNNITARNATAKNAAWRESKDGFGRQVFELANFKITKEEIRNASERKHGLPFTVSKNGSDVIAFKTVAEAKSFVENEIKRGK